MFDWFGRKPDYNNVVKPVPYIAPPGPSLEEAYSIGTTVESTHMTLKIGYSTLTMNKAGVENLIQQLQVFRDQLTEDEE